MERWVHKVLALLVVLVVIFVFTAMPIKVSGFFTKRGPTGYRLLTILNCFGGGVFFGAYLMHMTPEVKNLLNAAWLIPNDITFPMPELFMGAGFFLLMFAEKGISMLMTQKIRGKRRTSQQDARAVSITIGDKQTKCDDKDANQPNINNVMVTNKQMNISSIEDPSVDSESISQDAIPQNIDAMPPLVPGAKGNTLQSFILLAALSLDCIFEGMSLGLQRTSAGVWNLVLAILSHEVVIAFTLGFELFKVNSAKKTFFYAIFYAFTAPVGIAIGIVIVETGEPSPSIDIVSGIFQAMSAGVFIYCTFLEVLPGQIGHNAKLVNIIAVFIGFAFMALMALIPEPDNAIEDPGLEPSPQPGLPKLSHIPYLIKLILPNHK